MRYDLFATEKPDAVYLSYTVEAPCVNLTGAGRNPT